jgi:AcrR family transcriptional regulator
MSTGSDELPIWMRPEPGERRPAYTRDQIVQTALRIADEDGFEAVSMRRIAAELGAGTMTLYYYVRTKDELIALMADAIMGELLVPEDELPEGWREGMAEIARRTFAVFRRHRWVAEHIDDERESQTVGPNTLRHVEQSLAVAARTGLGVEDQFELVAFLDDYVFGYAMRTRVEERDPMFSKDETVRRRLDAVLAYLDAQLGTGEFPHLEAFVGDDPAAAFERLAQVAADEARFERGLERVLDGIALDVQSRRA